MKNIIFIQPPSPFLLEPLWKIPLTLCLLTTFLYSKGFNVEIVDLAEDSVEPPWPNIPLNGDIYGISVYTPQHTTALRVASYLKKNTNAIIIAGGHHVTALQEKYIKNSQFDILVLGEGEQTLLEISQNIPLDKIKGIIYQKDGKIFKTPQRERIEDISIIPLPRFDHFDISLYKGNQIDNSFHIGVVTSRGCYFKCSFCSSRFFWKQKVTWYPGEMIIEYLNYLKSIGIYSIEFMDDNLVIHPEFEKICIHLKNNNIKWTCMARSDCINEKKARIIGDCLCSGVSLGIESGSDNVLKKMEKRLKVKDHIKAIKLLKKHNVTVKALMIAGFPGETSEDALQTEHFIKTQPIDLFSFCSFVPFPGTPVWNYPDKYNAKIDKSIPFEEYVLVSKDFGPRSILDNVLSAKKNLDRYIKAAGNKCTNIKAFQRTTK